MKGADDSPAVLFRRRFFSDRSALAGVVLILLMVGVAVFAPLLANEKPLMVISATGEWSFPAFRGLFSTRSPEIFIELGFNYCLCCLPAFAVILLILRRESRVWKSVGLLTVAAVLLTPFLFHSVKFDGTNWREEIPKIRQAGGIVLTAPIPYGPFETIGTPYEEPSKEHWLGVDHSGRDVAARMIYGARVSSAVGFLATGISLLIGTFLGLLAGYRGGKTDLAIMRLVEIVICFPTFLLLLILMSIMLDYDSRQSILLVILVIGFTAAGRDSAAWCGGNAETARTALHFRGGIDGSADKADSFCPSAAERIRSDFCDVHLQCSRSDSGGKLTEFSRVWSSGSGGKLGGAAAAGVSGSGHLLAPDTLAWTGDFSRGLRIQFCRRGTSQGAFAEINGTGGGNSYSEFAFSRVQ